MTKKASWIKIRRPRLRITSKGIRWVNTGVSIGGKAGRVNISRQGVNTTIGGPGASYNTKRGCLLSPFTWLGMLFGRK